MKGQAMKLRNMSAYVTEEKNIAVELASGEILNLENALFCTAMLAAWRSIARCAFTCSRAMITA